MVVQHNISAMNANRYYGINNSGLSKSLEKLSSGYAINRAGDNAAGLAVSEKMRSQIGGLTQGVKNAQDGISMIQTFEGALTETDSILQRMKTLAVQSANGTYQDDVDRDAIQLEFNQLNDELNQIADTDYNGVIVLNGGQMADGTVAKDGKFDYTLGRTTQVVANEATDLSSAANQAHTIVDQTKYNKTKADAVYDALGVDVKSVADKTTGKATVNVTFMYDGDRWMAQTVTDTKGNVIEGANAANLEARAVDKKDASGKGGFEVVAGKDPYTGEDIIATNAIFNEMKDLKKGDTVTISFDNSMSTTYAPKNGGIAEDSIDADATATFTEGEVRNLIGFKLDSTLVDSTMSSDLKAVLDDFTSKAEATATYTGGKVDDLTSVTITGTAAVATYEVDADGSVKATSADTGKEYTLGKLTLSQFVGSTPAQPAKVENVASTAGTTGIAFGDNNSKDSVAAVIVGKLAAAATAADTAKYTVTATLTKGTDDNSDSWAITYTYKDADGNDVNGTGTLTGTEMKAGLMDSTTGNPINTGDLYNRANLNGGDKITFDYTAKTSPKNDLDATMEGDVKFKFNVDAYNYADMSDLNVHAVETPEVATMASQVADKAENGVSQSNAFKQASAPLTYTDHIVLQSGARSKDAVDFTFKYSSGGMGSLKSNMNCSAREDGLNTESLSLSTAKDANFAIDRIDNAINKVSMVRATFGAAQNRLEHKIDNMNVTKENITSAESRIRDTNMAEEMSNFTRNQILSQASQSMLAQANSLPQSVLQLLG